MKDLKIMKTIKGRIKLVAAGTALGTGLLFTACEVVTPDGQTIVVDENGNVTTNPTNPTNPTTPTDPVEPEVVEPEVVEPEVVEPVEEEKKYDYTVEGITNLYVDIFNNNNYLEKDEAWALVIAANMDNIAEEDLNTLLDNKGFTLESLSTSYYNAIYKLSLIKINKEHSVSFGGDVTYGIDENMLNLFNGKKIKFDDLFIAEEYKELCTEEMETQYYDYNMRDEPQGELRDHLLNAKEDSYTNGDVALFNLYLACCAYDEELLNECLINPYDLLLEKQLTK